MKIVPQTALYILSQDRKEVLLLKRWAHKSLAWKHTGIGWHVEPDELEDIEQSVLRELEEETHITRNDIMQLEYKATVVHAVQDKWDRVMYAYTAIAKNREDWDLYTDDWELIRYEINKLPHIEKTWLTEAIFDKILSENSPRLISWYRHHNVSKKVFCTE